MRKIISFDPETYDALVLLGRDRMSSLEELADEAFRDLLIKHGRPTSLKDALRRSLKEPVQHTGRLSKGRRPTGKQGSRAHR